MIKKIDAYLTSYFPILVASYFIYTHSFFAWHMFVVCWLSMTINMTFLLETYSTLLTTKNSLISILNLLLFGGLALFGIISMKGFLLSVIISETTALIVAIIYSFISSRSGNSESAWKAFGITGTMGFILLFSGTIYPYLGEWYLYLKENVELIVILGALINFIVNISRKIKTLENVADTQSERKHVNKSRVTKHILLSIGIWFVGLGILYGVSN